MPERRLIAGIGASRASTAWCRERRRDRQGGTYYPMTSEHLRAQEIAQQNTCRLRYLAIRAAPSCPAGRVFRTASTSAGIFYNQAQMSAGSRRSRS